MENRELELRATFVASLLLVISTVYALGIIAKIEPTVENYIGLLPIMGAIGLVNLVAFIGVELNYLASGTLNWHHRKKVIILWAIEGVISLLIASIPSVIFGVATKPYLGIQLGIIILILRLWWKDKQHRTEFETDQTIAYFKGKIIKESKDVIEAQFFKGIKGNMTHGEYILEPRFEVRLPNLILGVPGSGKTLWLLAYLLPNILRQIANREPVQLFIQDVKNELVEVFNEAGVPCIITNPGDTRAKRLELCDEIHNFEMCREVAGFFTLLSDKKGETHWTRSAQRICASVMYGLTLIKEETPDFKWQLREVLLIIEDTQLLCSFLGKFEQTKHIMESYGKFEKGQFTPSKSGLDVLSTLAGITEKLRTLAAWWYDCEESYTLKQWVSTRGILHSGFSANYPAISKITSQINVYFAYKHIMSRSEAEGSRSYTHFVFEEGAMVVPLPYHEEMLKAGRSKGIILTLIVQSLRDFIGAHIKAGVPEKVAQGILDFYGQRQAWFRLTQEDAHYITKYMIDRPIHLEVTNDGRGGVRKFAKEGIALEPHSLINNPKPGPAMGCQGYFYIGGTEPEQGVHYWHRDWDDVVSKIPTQGKESDYTEKTKVDLKPLSKSEKSILLSK